MYLSTQTVMRDFTGVYLRPYFFELRISIVHWFTLNSSWSNGYKIYKIICLFYFLNFELSRKHKSVKWAYTHCSTVYKLVKFKEKN